MTLMDKVLEQIKEDVAMGDMTAIEELLTKLVRNRTEFLLSGYLSDADTWRHYNEEKKT